MKVILFSFLIFSLVFCKNNKIQDTDQKPAINLLVPDTILLKLNTTNVWFDNEYGGPAVRLDTLVKNYRIRIEESFGGGNEICDAGISTVFDTKEKEKDLPVISLVCLKAEEGFTNTKNIIYVRSEQAEKKNPTERMDHPPGSYLIKIKEGKTEFRDTLYFQCGYGYNFYVTKND